MHKAPTSIDWASELADAINNDLSVRQLSIKLGVSVTAVLKHEHRTGLRLKRVHKTIAHKGNSSGIDWPTVLREAQATDISTTSLACSLSVSLGSVLSAEDRTGIYLKRRHPNKRRIGGFRDSDENAD